MSFCYWCFPCPWRPSLWKNSVAVAPVHHLHLCSFLLTLLNNNTSCRAATAAITGCIGTVVLKRYSLQGSGCAETSVAKFIMAESRYLAAAQMTVYPDAACRLPHARCSPWATTCRLLPVIACPEFAC